MSVRVNTRLRRAAWLGALMLGACAGTETGNPSFSGSLGYDAYSSAPRAVAIAAALTAGAGEPTAQSLRVDNAWLVLGDVELLRGDACASSMDADSDDQTLVHGLGAGDHVGGQAPVTSFELATGQYCGARLPIVHAADGLPDRAPDSLRDESIVLLGTLPDGRDFELRSALETQVLLRATGSGFVLDHDRAGVLIGFDVAKWLGETDWSQATAEDSGRVLISAQQNRELLQHFERALPQGVALFRDADRDGLLDADHEPLAVAP